MEKILITGSGLLASELAEKFSNSEVYLTYRKNKVDIKNSIFLDITDKDNLEKNILKIKPDTIIHTAAITDLDWCEKNVDETFKINTEASINIRKIAEKINSKLIFISTDSVFDGKNGKYEEEDEKNPINIYSKSKFLAEKDVQKYDKSLIIRGTFFGLKNDKKESFFSYLLNELMQKKKIPIPKDKISNGLFVKDFSEIIAKMSKKNLSGIYHLGSTDFKNNVEFAKQVAEICSFDKELIEECLFDEIFDRKKLIAKRPLNTTLNVEKISKEIKMPTVREVITSFSKNYKTMVQNEVEALE